MYMTNAVPRNTVVPYWNEIKNLSWEDRSNLAELIEVSLNEDDSDENSRTFAEQLDDTAMKAAAEFAFKEGKAGKCIPHSQVLDMVKEELGWK